MCQKTPTCETASIRLFFLPARCARRQTQVRLPGLVSVSRSVVSNFVTPWTTARQASLSMEFSRNKYWSGLPFPSPGDLPDPGIKSGLPTLQADALPSEPPGKSNVLRKHLLIKCLNINLICPYTTRKFLTDILLNCFNRESYCY